MRRWGNASWPRASTLEHPALAFRGCPAKNCTVFVTTQRSIQCIRSQQVRSLRTRTLAVAANSLPQPLPPPQPPPSASLRKKTLQFSIPAGRPYEKGFIVAMGRCEFDPAPLRILGGESYVLRSEYGADKKHFEPAAFPPPYEGVMVGLGAS